MSAVKKSSGNAVLDREALDFTPGQPVPLVSRGQAGRCRQLHRPHEARALGGQPMRISTIVVAAVVLFRVTASSGQGGTDDPWSTARINNLPAEVRTAVLAMCPTVPSAGHYFATYFHNQINLHFDLFYCENSKVALQPLAMPATGLQIYCWSLPPNEELLQLRE